MWTSVCQLISGSIAAVGVVHSGAVRLHSLSVSVKYIEIFYDQVSRTEILDLCQWKLFLAIRQGGI